MAIKTASGSDLRNSLSSGLVLLNTTSFSGVASVSLPANTFSTTYDSYLVILKCGISTASYMNGRLRSSGADDTTSNYQSGWTGIILNGGGASSDTAGAASNIWSRIGYASGSGEIWIAYTFHNPKLTGRTMVTYQQTRIDAVANSGGAIFNAATSFDSASFLANSGTITGSVSAYGYNQ